MIANITPIKIALGYIVITGINLWIEYLQYGYQNSAVKRLLDFSRAGIRMDWYYFILSATDLKIGLSVLMGFFLGIPFAYYITKFIGFSLLAGLPYLISFPIVGLVNTFCFYMAHRLMHTKILWPIHEAHHSSTEFNVISGHRNHPFAEFVNTLVYTIPAALMGADPIVIAAYQFLNGIYQQQCHSNIRWGNSIFAKVFVSPERHRTHHSLLKSDFNKNFGTLVLWEKIFNTYEPEIKPTIAIGLKDYRIYSRNYFLQDLFVYWNWLKNLFKSTPLI